MTTSNKHTGDIAKKIDYIVWGLSKCGTTTLYTSLNEIGNCIKLHSDETLQFAYGTKALTVKSIIERTEHPTIFTLYRNPIARKISQYYEYRIGGQLIDYCLDRYTINNDAVLSEVSEDLVYKHILDVTGINVLDHPFDKELGHTIIEKDNITLVPCTLEKIDNLAEVFDFTLVTRHVTKKTDDIISFSPADLDRMCASKYCQHFYTEHQIDEFKRRDYVHLFKMFDTTGL